MERIGCRKEQTDRKHWMAVHTLKWAWKGLRSDRQEYGMSRGFWAPFFRFLADRKKCARLSTRGYKGVVFEFGPKGLLSEWFMGTPLNLMYQDPQKQETSNHSPPLPSRRLRFHPAATPQRLWKLPSPRKEKLKVLLARF